MSTKQTEALKLALKLALEALKGGLWDYGPGQDEHQRCNEVIAICEAALAEQPAQQEPDTKDVVINNMGRPFTVKAYTSPPAQQQEPVSDRENSIIRFALHQFMSNAYAHLTAAAQDKEGKRYPSEAVEKFAKDAEDAQALLKRLQFTSPPASKPWVGLVHEETHEAIGTAGVDLLELAKMWSDNKIHVYQFDNEARKIIEVVLRRASAKLREKNAQPSKPLTDEQVTHLWRENDPSPHLFARAIEAAHGIKGDA